MRWLLALCLALVLPACASAQSFVPGLRGTGSAVTPPTVQTFQEGAKTRAGYGGFIPAGLSGALTINSERLGTGGTPCSSPGSTSTDLVVNTDFDGVSGQIVPAGTYGGTPPTYNANGYCLSITGTGGTVQVNVPVVPNAASVKSQYAFATHADAANTANQIGVVMSSASSAVIAQGDKLLLRDGAGTGIRPAINPYGCSNAGSSGITCFDVQIEPPAGGYAASTGGTYTCQTGPLTGQPCIEITSDTQGTITAPDGFLAGGGAHIGEIFINNLHLTSRYLDPIEFAYVTFERDQSYANGIIPRAVQLDSTNGLSTDGADAYGWGCFHCEWFNNIPADIAQIWFLEGAKPHGGAFEYNYAHGNYLVAFLPSPVLSATGVIDTSAVTTLVHNDVTALENDFMDIAANASNIDFEYNFSKDLNAQTQNPTSGEYVIVAGPSTSQVYTFGPYSDTLGAVPLSPTPALSLINLACTVNNGGAIALTGNGGTQGSTYTCVAGTNYPATQGVADPNVSVTNFNDVAPNTILTFTNLTVGTQSLAIYAGSTAWSVCSNASAKPPTNPTNCATTSAGVVGFSTIAGISVVQGTVSTSGHGAVTFDSNHNDISQWDNTLAAATTAAGSITSNVFTAPTGTTWQVGQYLFGPNITATTQIASGVVAGSCSAGCTVTGQATAASAAISGTLAPLRPGGTDAYNIGVRNNSLPNRNEPQFEFIQQAICCLASTSGTPGILIHHNISNLTETNAAYLQEVYNPTVEFNTLLNDAESNAWAPCIGIVPGVYDPTQSCAAQGLSVEPSYDPIAQPVWSVIVNRADIIPIANYGGGGGTFDHNLSNYFGGSLQTTTSQPAPWNLASGTLTLTPNENVGSGLGLGNWSYPTTLFPAQACNANSAGEPCDGTTVFASYKLMFPTLASGYQTALTTRAASIAAFTPVPGTPFNGSITVSTACMTVTSGTTPALWSPINGPGIQSGSIVTVLSGGACSAGQLTLSIKATATETAAGFDTLSTNPDGSINGALTYADSAGAACWNDGRTNFNQALTCAAQGLTPATQDVPPVTPGQLDFSKPANSALIPVAANDNFIHRLAG